MKKPKIVVLGAAGMLGHKLFQLLRQNFDGTIGTVREDVRLPPLDRVSLLQGTDVVGQVDVANFDSVQTRLEAWAPEVIVNCVGIIRQREEASIAIPSILINSLFPHRLAEASACWGGRVIHFSTDCVFSGRKGKYSEEDPPDAEDLYGRSKLLGEVVTPNAITLRTSIIGRELTEHRSLLDWFLSQEGNTVRGYRKVIYSGVTTNEMADVVTRVILEFPKLSGLFHVVSAPISKNDLLCLIREAYGVNVSIEKYDGEVSDRSMSGEKFREVTGWRAPTWPEMVRQMAADRTPYEAWGASVGRSGGRGRRDV